MLNTLLQLLGGIGLFLLGMNLMTDSLKALAGEALRQWLVRFTDSPLKAMFSGMTLTMVVQSSTATTLATIGFVSAGVLTFSNAIGVIIGANIGTTSTGWMVALLGLKFSIAKLALPLIAVGAILKLLAQDRLALFGMAIAGFGLLFFGIDVLQQAMSAVADTVDLSRWSADSLWGSLLLVLIGLVMTILLQSSSAAITATLAALASQAINLEQTLTLVIGQNVGTVLTAILAAIGATASAKRTAAVHVIFNAITAIFAFVLLLPAFLWAFQHVNYIHSIDPVLIVAAFHTCFSVLGALIFMPFIGKFEQILVKLIPEHEVSLTRYLDDSLYSVPALAIAATERVLLQSIVDIYRLLIKFIRGEIISPMINTNELDATLKKVEAYLEQMEVPQSSADQQRLILLLRLLVYVRVLRNDLNEVAQVDLLKKQQILQELPNVLAEHLERQIVYLQAEPFAKFPSDFVEELVQLEQFSAEQQDFLRQKIIHASVNHQLTASQTLELLAAQRWIVHLITHTQRVAMLLKQEEATE
ncbi:Na/Pi cotransporter family protein [Acinetobacter kanungonis]|uniref:Na/Pi cotransporter family protein n=1 Tax=Acinetobacter kanungonis TaxID=2699469 RepID=UPI00137A33D5|nr:Na/Pi symporter [Acinetobacter kanungonis]NCI79835.1 Na/Pi cotransporter family protein [Acinetobacter kanungonis]